MEIEIRPLTQISATDLKRVSNSYVATGKYVVEYTDAAEYTAFQLRLVPLDKPYVKAYDHFDAATVERYAQALKADYSFGAWAGDTLVGFLISEPQLWNESLWVHEFHVAETHRRLGIGRRLMDAVAEKATAGNLRTIVCETQNTNVPAIQAYRKLGFRMEGVDIAYYSNRDYPDGEVAVFMKRRLS